MPSIGKRAEALRIEGHLPQPELRELEVFDDLRPKESRYIGRGADLESRRDFVRDARAADSIRPLHDEDAEPCLRKVVRGDQAVVAGADDNDVRGNHELAAEKCSGRMLISSRPPFLEESEPGYRRRLRAGFSTSSNPYPSIANPRTTSVMKIPGGAKYSQSPRSKA